VITFKFGINKYSYVQEKINSSRIFYQLNQNREFDEQVFQIRSKLRVEISRQLEIYLSSCQKEFASNSGSTSVAFMIRAARTALEIYSIEIQIYKYNTQNTRTTIHIGNPSFWQKHQIYLAYKRQILHTKKLWYWYYDTDKIRQGCGDSWNFLKSRYDTDKIH